MLSLAPPFSFMMLVVVLAFFSLQRKMESLFSSILTSCDDVDGTMLVNLITVSTEQLHIG